MAKKLTNSENRMSLVMSGIENCPEPSYFFNVGDKVSIGNLQNCTITEIIMDGKIYGVEFDRVERVNYKEVIRHDEGYWEWYNIRPLKNETNHSLIKNEDIRLHYTQRQIESLLGSKYHFGINMFPSYQRDYVWEAYDNVLLIDSIFKNIDIGKFVFVKLPYKSNSPAYEILDGKQRLNALSLFYENKFSYCNMYYNDLSKREQHHFLDYPISYAELRNINEEQKMHYFLMLNRAGKVMSESQLNKVERMLLKGKN